VLIGKGGETRRMIEEACGAKLEIDSKSGDVMADWGEGEADPVIRMKMPDVIVAIGRGLAPMKAVQLVEDEVSLRMYDIREWVGRQPNQTRHGVILVIQAYFPGAYQYLGFVREILWRFDNLRSYIYRFIGQCRR